METAYQERMAAAMATALAAKRSMAPENAAEMRLYLDKLKDLVPLCPKNRKVTKLELIQHVIDYIGDLQDTLQSDSESDGASESPLEHMNFSDAYMTSQQPGHNYSMDYRLGSTSGCSSSASSSGYTKDFRSSGFSDMESSTSSTSGFSSESSNYSTILYSDQGSSAASGFRSSCYPNL
ncbi:uncharacterized protein [Cherax quadricarinatus]|uniref:uncharacterized protein n=1 Tax=Cherax quadricarinatus TaxID=27406 RepID=UPI0023787A21|nr:uncharacterized protein LOC128690700 [Cherax quadricarinatus]